MRARRRDVCRAQGNRSCRGRYHQRSRAQGPLYGAARGEDDRSISPRPATDRNSRRRSAPASSTAISHSGLIAFCAAAAAKLFALASAVAALAELIASSLDHMPARLLRPFIMSFVTTALAPSPALFEAGALLVNARGARFINELAAPAFDIAEQPDKIGFLLLDARTAKAFTAWPHFISTAPGVAYAYLDDYRRNRRDIYASASSLEELAARLGMRADALAQSISRYNETCGNRPKFGAGPYVALGPVRAVFVHAECALAVDHEHRVLGKDEKPIPGLFAAGSTGQGGLLLKGHGHHLGWAFASGCRAGKNAATMR